VVRTRRPLFKSKPGRYLWLSTLLVAVVALVLPYFPLSRVLGFVPMPLPVLLLVLGITMLYIVASEVAKKVFYARVSA
jgi:Mg2+-importing ATPase